MKRHRKTRALAPAAPDLSSTARLTPAQLDDILALQLAVAWAGESAGNPPRLGWWKTDLVDKEGGGDLWARLIPKSATWASLALVRMAALTIDERAREKLARGDAMWTPFHFGFDVDEQLDDMLVYHRRHEDIPADVFGSKWLLGRPWSKASLETLLGGLPSSAVEVTPAGRRVAASVTSAIDAAPLLFAALLPLVPTYPLPYLERPA
ncbi:MAG TPA: BREX-6 system BrxE protein [Polyangiaceae bacterium]|nr:BREX-6 system BrxE protein [Polyangiaceae bacterium]